MSKKRGKACVDWDQIRADYVTGSQSLGVVSRIYGIPAGTIYKRAATEKWSEQRRDYRSQAYQGAIERLAEHDREDLYHLIRAHRDTVGSLHSRFCELAQEASVAGEVEQLVELARLARMLREEAQASGLSFGDTAPGDVNITVSYLTEEDREALAEP